MGNVPWALLAEDYNVQIDTYSHDYHTYLVTKWLSPNQVSHDLRCTIFFINLYAISTLQR